MATRKMARKRSRDYPDPPSPPVTSVQGANAYQFVLDRDEEANIAITFTGSATGCAAMVHNALQGGPIFPPLKHNLGRSPEVFEKKISPDDRRRAFLVSAWTFVGEYSLNLPKGWWQVPIQNDIDWIPGVGGRVSFSCPGSSHGATQVDAVITVRRTS